MEEILQKYFQYERTRYYNPGDNINAEHYLRYSPKGNGEVCLSIGSDDGEVEVIQTDSPQKMENIIKTLLFS